MHIMYTELDLYIKAKYFTLKDYVNQLRKTMLKVMKSYIRVTIFVENTVENVKNVKRFTCFNKVFHNFEVSTNKYTV